MKRPWMPLYIGDYLRDTAHLTQAQHGAYLLLIMHYWTHGGLPTDQASLRRIARHSDQRSWASTCSALAGFFDENWRHRRIDGELEKANKIREKRAYAGRQRALLGQESFRLRAPAHAQHMHPPSQPHKESSLLSTEPREEGQKNGQSISPGSLATAPPTGALARPARVVPISESLEEVIKRKGWVNGHA